MKYAVMVAAMLGALGAHGAYAQGDNNMGGTSPPDQEQLPQKSQTPLPEQAPDRSTMKSDQDTSANQTKSTDQASAKKTETNTETTTETFTDQNGKTVASTDLLFDTAKSDLKAGADAQLQPIADWAKCNTKGAVIIEGHADPRGTADYNAKLSARRAAVVRERLVALGVPSARIVIGVWGKTGPRRATFAEDRRATVRPAMTPVEATELTAQR
jgi:outer membrane protein OmpA-like peptidoglycan-associated protein